MPSAAGQQLSAMLSVAQTASGFRPLAFVSLRTLMLRRERFVRLNIWPHPEAYYWLTVLSLGWYHVITIVKINFIPEKYRVWIDARNLLKLSHLHVQMARELGMNPKKLGKLNNHKQEPWKRPLPVYLEELYRKRFGRSRPGVVASMEELAKREMNKRQAKAGLKEHLP